MKHVPGYGKILTLGALYTQDALKGEVVIQEKVDGSQFRFGINEDGEIVIASKGAKLDLEAPDKLFTLGVEYVKEKLKQFPELRDVYFYGEYLQKPRHNTLDYDRIPRNHIVLFDVMANNELISNKDLLEHWAEQLDIDVIPELHRGRATTETVMDLLKTQSYLGGQTLEGVVVKNYGERILYAGNEQYLFTKYVREEFKEMHSKNPDWMSSKNKAEALFAEFSSEPRWHKAVQHLRDAGKLTQSPKDIGMLIKEVPADILAENEDELKNRLWGLYKKDFASAVTRGLPQWYKDQLMKTLEEQ